MLHPGRHQRRAARAAISAMTSSVSPVPCSMQSTPAATSSATACSPKQCAVTRAPTSCAPAIASAATSAGQQRREVAGVAVDPVADDLDPAVAAAGLPVSTSATRSAGSTSAP